MLLFAMNYRLGSNRAKKSLVEFKKQTTSWSDFCDLLNKKCVLLAPFCGDKECEKQIKEASALYAFLIFFFY